MGFCYILQLDSNAQCSAAPPVNCSGNTDSWFILANILPRLRKYKSLPWRIRTRLEDSCSCYHNADNGNKQSVTLSRVLQHNEQIQTHHKLIQTLAKSSLFSPIFLHFVFGYISTTCSMDDFLNERQVLVT